MMTVSVITPTRLAPERIPLLLELNQSLRHNACAVEHVVVVDGNSIDAVPAELRDRATIFATPKPIGQAAARNLALGLAQGDWITSADDDDLLPPQSIDQRLAALNRQPGALWAAGYLTDASRRHLEVMAPGPCAPGDVWRAWPQPEATIPLGPTSLLVQRPLLQRLGGWMGLPQGEDLGMMMAVTCTAPGVLADAWVYHYRMHSGQMTKAPGFNTLETLCRRCAWQRGALLMDQSQSEPRQP